MPLYTTHECTDLDTFRSFIQTIWAANHHPYQPYFSAYNPVFGPTLADRTDAIERSCQRKWATHLATPASHWVYVLDEKSGQVAGATEWRLYEQSPYAGGESAKGGLPYEADVWPEGSVGREFVEMMLRRQYAHRRRWLDCRHAGQCCISLCMKLHELPFASPAHMGTAIASIFCSHKSATSSVIYLKVAREILYHSNILCRLPTL